MTAQLHRLADLTRRTQAFTGRPLTLLPPPRTVAEIDAGLPPKAFELAETFLDDASILPGDRDLLLGLLAASVHEQPGPYVKHVVESHRLWLEALPEVADEETADEARRVLDDAIRELVTR